jgi:hypothetical protein
LQLSRPFQLLQPEGIVGTASAGTLDGVIAGGLLGLTGSSPPAGKVAVTAVVAALEVELVKAVIW